MLRSSSLMTDAVCAAACLWFVPAMAFGCAADGPGVRREDPASGWRDAASPPTVHFCFIFHGQQPNHLVAGWGENKTDPVSFSLFSVFFEVSMASAKSEGGGGGVWEGLLENPALPLSRRRLLTMFKGLASCFPADGFTLHLHAEITHSICENHLLEQTRSLVLMQFKPCNYALATHACSVYQTRVWPLEILRLHTHQIHVMSA